MTPDHSAEQTDVLTESAEAALGLLRAGRGHVLLVAPAGFGKSHTLRHLARGCRELGMRVEQYAAPTDEQAPDILVVDDAHLLPSGELDRLARTDATRSRVLAAVEPTPDGSYGAALDQLAAHGSTVALEPWTVDDIESLLGAGSDDLLDAQRVIALTGGLPWLVTEVLQDPATAGQPSRPGQPTRAERQILRAVARLPTRVSEVLMALCAGYPVDRGPLPTVLGDLTASERRDLLDRVYDAGVLSRDGQVPPLVRRAVLHHVPRYRIRPHLASLLDDLQAARIDLLPLAEVLVGAGLNDPRLAVALEERGDALLDRDPMASASLYASAAECGGDDVRLSVRRAEALALAGDLEGAAGALETASGRQDLGWASGVRMAATIATLRGQPHQAAELCRWAATQEGLLTGDDEAAGTVSYVLYGDGAPESAGSTLDAERHGTPGLTGPGMRAMAGAVRSSLGQDPWSALSALVQASLAPDQGRTELLPEHPAALAALLALNAGDLAMADTVLSTASTHPSSVPAHRSRLVALRAWTSMQAGRYAHAEALLAAIDPDAPREQPWVWGLRVGLARRQDDTRALARHWVDARGALVGHPVDLYSLLPLGEIGLAAARMREPELAAPLWDRAMALLDRLGNPPAWSPAFHWYGVQAAILTDRPSAMTPHAAVLVSAARTSPYAAALARAGKSWVAVLGRDVDPPSVEAAARGLASVGQSWEGARLAGHAAARAADRKDTSALMECARDLLAPTAGADSEHRAPSLAESKAGVVTLSPREREVVELVLAGMTYRQIGESLYLSAKTVEHHMARIKRRSGVTTRSELLDRLSLSVR